MDKIKLLLVDDEEDFVKALAERIKMRKVGSQIAFNGEMALEMVNDEVPDVMVLDIRMPGIDGLEVLKKVKQQYPKVQVIILTGHGTQQEVEKAKSLGAFSTFKKPVDINTLLDSIKQAYSQIDRTMSAVTFAEAGEADTAREYLNKKK